MGRRIRHLSRKLRHKNTLLPPAEIAASHERSPEDGRVLDPQFGLGAATRPQREQETTTPKIGAANNSTMTKYGENQGELTKESKDMLGLADTTTTDKATSQNPVVTHETVQPHVHEVIQDQVYRDIHEHEVYHRIQPVYALEVAPPRHFVPDPNGDLIEVLESDLPHCTGANQRWAIGEMQPAGDLGDYAKLSSVSQDMIQRPNEEQRMIDAERRMPSEKAEIVGGNYKASSTTIFTSCLHSFVNKVNRHFPMRKMRNAVSATARFGMVLE
ncbi:hypothetical protein JX266_003620 [Neoarthrinium moseri]|uniref:uncharacterized protein n=1 Tax=Neoarthrinium moseri TaxID=1658444 RepID=UPI001FDBE095|nr:uncharacterized protein JN550_012089 [Neoarthrinium moseri]KAI1850955.1 hypothetical protein JX266_003620 [Neoarthrinium moseri]KAI1859280.1 hypothetical protein JN550_012089 [Neoarthrinium moseri]